MLRVRSRWLGSAIALAVGACDGTKDQAGPKPGPTSAPRGPAGAVAGDGPGAVGAVSAGDSKVAGASEAADSAAGEAQLPAETPVDVAAGQQLVDTWLAAQNANDFATYEKLYAARMEGVKRAGPRTRRFDRAGWIADRKQMFERKPMKVAIRDLTIGGSAVAPTVQFTQTFQQGRFADEGIKRMVLARGPGGALQIAREEMLVSVIGGQAASSGPVSLVVKVEGKDHVVLAVDADPKWGRGAIRGPFGSSPMLATRSAGEAPAASAWAGKAMAVYTAAGKRCEATVGALRLLGGGTPHFGEVQVWDGDPAMSPDGRVWSRAERARAVFGIGPLYLVGELAITGDCEPAYATEAAASVTPFASVEAEAPLKAAAIAAFRGQPAYAEIQRSWKDDYAGAGEWVATPGVTSFAAGDRRYVVVSAQEGTGCGSFEGSLTVVFAAEGARLTRVSDPAEGALGVVAMVDGDGDGEAEIVGTTGDWSVTSAYLTPSRSGFAPAITLSFPFKDCGC